MPEYGYRIHFMNGGQARGWVISDSLKQAARDIRRQYSMFTCFGVWLENIPSHVLSHGGEYVKARVIGWSEHGGKRTKKHAVVRTMG